MKLTEALDYISTRERNIALGLIVELTALTVFVAKLLSLPEGTSWLSWEMGKIVTQIIVIIIATHIVLSILLGGKREEPADERDLKISLKATQLAYWGLIAGVVIIIGSIFQTHTITKLKPEFLLSWQVDIGHIVIGLFVTLSMSSIIKAGAELYLYRWGRF